MISLVLAAVTWAGAFLFSVNDPSLYSVVESAAGPNTRISTGLAAGDPKLPTAVGGMFALPTSIASSVNQSHTSSAGTIYYDGEHWPQTPLGEQNNMAQSVYVACRAITGAGKVCGAAPDGQFLGINPTACTFNLYNGIVPQTNWLAVGAVNLQAQALANDVNCSDTQANYLAFVIQAAAMIRAENPSIFISAQLSLRDSAPATIVANTNALVGIVDAVYIAYPAPCTNCTPANLQTVLNALK